MLITRPKNDRTIEPKNALKNPATLNPGAKYPASINNKAFITNPKSPSVIIFIGKVINTIKGLIKMFIKAIITVTSIALWKLSTSIPGTSQATNIIARANNNHLTNNTIIFPFSLLHLYFKYTKYNFNSLNG